RVPPRAHAAWDRPSGARIHRITSAEDRGCLLVGNLVGNAIRYVGIHQHVLGVPALGLDSCAFHKGAEHSAATLATFAAPTRGLNTGGTHAVAPPSAS